MKKLLSLATILLLVGGLVFAQNKAALTIQCNQSGAQVFVAGRLLGTTTPTLSVLIPAGTYQVKVSKAGFNPFDTTVNLPASGATITVNLVAVGAVATPPPPPPPQQAASYALTITSPRPNTQVFINGQMKGNAPLTMQVAPGSYMVMVRAPGMMEWSQQVQVVNGPVTVNPGMAPQPPPSFPVQAGATNAPGAAVFLNGNQVGSGSYSASLPAGTYTIVLRAPGFTDYSETFNLAGPKTISVALQQSTFPFQVSASNAPGAVITLNGNQIATGGYSGALAPGTYTVVIRAPGFLDYSETFNLNAPKAISVALQQQTFAFQVSASNAPGAVIFLNGNQIATGGYSGALAPGTYTVIIRAPGFTDYSETFNLAAPKAISVALQQMLVSFTLSIPQAFVNTGAAGGQIQAFVDNNPLQATGPASFTGAVVPGQHNFRIVSGGLKVESTLNLQAGKNWTIEAGLGLSAK